MNKYIREDNRIRVITDNRHTGFISEHDDDYDYQLSLITVEQMNENKQ